LIKKIKINKLYLEVGAARVGRQLEFLKFVAEGICAVNFVA
jgi:hypothetical protein